MSGGCTAFSGFIDAADGSVWDWVGAETEAESEAEVDVEVEGTVVVGCVVVADMFVCERWWGCWEMGKCCSRRRVVVLCGA